MNAIILLNESAGTLKELGADEARERIERAFNAAGATARVRFAQGDEIQSAAREAAQSSDGDAVIAGGGDGTINSIAGIIAESDKAFGVLPLGTHNHFAKDLGISLDLEEAIGQLARAKVTELPVGEVNGQLFLNFSGIGLHPEVVREREAHRRETGRSKWFSMMVAMTRLLKDLPAHRVTLSAGGRTIARRTPSVIVCNNPHQMKVFGVEDASVPERGLLNVYIATRSTRRSVLTLMTRAATGGLKSSTAHFEAMALPDVRIDSRHSRLAVSIDGEVMDMRTPLLYRIRSRPLKVLAPADSLSPEGRGTG